MQRVEAWSFGTVEDASSELPLVIFRTTTAVWLVRGQNRFAPWRPVALLAQNLAQKNWLASAGRRVIFQVNAQGLCYLHEQ